ncbi:MAG: tetratricopeptide repeat protein, partial [Acidobacteriaceae bacterium]|nr:tetratricopeptide repeat protein [Acidobacteriaceae bacterium]
MQPELEEIWLQVDRIPDEEGRGAFLREHPSLLTAGTVEQLAEAVRTEVRVDLQKACRLAELAVWIAAELKDDEALGRALRAKANTVWFMGDCRSAVDLFDQAAALLERAGNLSEVGRTLSSSIQSRALTGEYETAYQAANKAREIFRSLGEGWRLARLEINVANILHRQNRYADALQAYERAYSELLPHKDAEGIGVALHNMAVCLIALDDYPAANKIYARARELCETHEMPLLVAQADYNIAYLHFLRGEYSKALELLRATRETCQKNGDHYHLALSDLDASGIYLELNLFQEAAEAAETSLAQFKGLGMNYEMVRSQLNLAIAVSLQGSSDRALSLFKEAHELARREENEILPALIDLHSSMVLFEKADFSKANELCRRALRVFESAGLATSHVTCRLLLGRIFLATDDRIQAARECDLALATLHELDAPTLRYQAEFLRGQILEASDDADGAYRAYQNARSQLETLRSGLQGSELKLGFMRNRVGVYMRLIQLCLDRRAEGCSEEEAFSYVEAAKSRTLQDLMLAGPQTKVPESKGSGRDAHIQ